MISAQQDLTKQVASRFQPIAGPFSTPEALLFEAVLQALRTTGARIVTVRERRGDVCGASIYRLRSECETREQTRRRLAKR